MEGKGYSKSKKLSRLLEEKLWEQKTKTEEELKRTEERLAEMKWHIDNINRHKPSNRIRYYKWIIYVILMLLLLCFYEIMN